MSIDVSTHRAGDESNPSGKTDVLLIALNTSLESTLQTASPGKLVDDLTQSLTSTYGARNVSSSTSGTTYEWFWKNEDQIWVFECVSRTLLTVDDGEPQPVKVQIAIGQAVA